MPWSGSVRGTSSAEPLDLGVTLSVWQAVKARADGDPKLLRLMADLVPRRIAQDGVETRERIEMESRSAQQALCDRGV